MNIVYTMYILCMNMYVNVYSMYVHVCIVYVQYLWIHGKLHFFSEIFLDSENFLRKSQIFRLHFLRKSRSYLRKCNLVFFSLGARFRITNYASENYF